MFDKKEYNRIQYYIYKECLTPSQRDEFLPKMITHIYSFSNSVTYDEYIQLFESKIEITQFPYKKWIQYTKDKVEMYKKMKPYMDLSARKEIMISMITNCYSNETLDDLLKVFIE